MLKLMEKTIWMVKLYDVRRIVNGLLVRAQSKGALLEKIERFKLGFTKLPEGTRCKMCLENA